MKLLIADADRDFLSTFRQLLTLEGHDVVTVFDGTQVITKTATEAFDLVILNYRIPRIKSRELIVSLAEKNIPVIVLLDAKVSSSLLLDDVVANAYLSFPFFPDELKDIMREVMTYLHSEETIHASDIEIKPAAFRLCGKIPVTAQEIGVMKALIGQKSIDAKRAEPYIHSLNNKLERLGKTQRIKYISGEGYRLVTDHG